MSEAINTEKKIDEFNNVAGVIFSCLGCVVGTGNLWRFPRMVAKNSGEEGAAVFYLAWFVSLFTWSIPLLVIEYAIGKYTRVSVIRIFVLVFKKIGVFFGGWVSLIFIFIASYYLVIVSWCFYYVVFPWFNELPSTEEESNKVFQNFTESNWPLITYVLCLTLTSLSTIWGVKGIEKVNIVLVPFMLSILLALFFYSFSITYSEYGLKFLFNADWNTLANPELYLDAISQNAFDTGAANGLITSYAIYLNDQSSIMRYSLFVPMINNFVSFLASLTIFSTVFGIMIQKFPTITQTELVTIMKSGGVAGTSLTFIWMPILMDTMGVFGRVVCSVFFVCFSFAGITSLISHIELLSLCLIEFGIKNRIHAVLSVSCTIFLMGLSSLLNLNFLANQDSVWGFSLILSGLCFVALVIKIGPEKFRIQIVNENKWKRDLTLPYIWVVLVTIVTPIEAFSLLIWWIYSEITKSPMNWYIPSWTSLITVWIEWILFAIILIILNVILVKIRMKWVINKGTLQIFEKSPEFVKDLILENPNCIAILPINKSYENSGYIGDQTNQTEF